MSIDHLVSLRLLTVGPFEAPGTTMVAKILT